MLDCVPNLIRDWDFLPGHVERWRYRARIEAIFRRSRAQPHNLAIKPIIPRDHWIVYFVYTPNGQLSESQTFTLQRLRDVGIGIFVVCAASTPTDVPSNLLQFADALHWKALPGYDFSAYTLALREISKRSPYSRVLVMNDSVFGPFANLRPFIDRAPWDLTGFTASSQIENHIQSYAFIVNSMTTLRMWYFRLVLFPFICLDIRNDVINCQELRFARVASRTMTVGSFWFSLAEKVIDPTLVYPFELLDDGYPFIKKSLLDKQSKFQDLNKVEARLRDYGHPIPTKLCLK